MYYYIYNRYGEGALYTSYCTAGDAGVYDSGGEKQQPLSGCVRKSRKIIRPRLSLLQRRRSISPPPHRYIKVADDPKTGILIRTLHQATVPTGDHSPYPRTSEVQWTSACQTNGIETLSLSNDRKRILRSSSSSLQSRASPCSTNNSGWHQCGKSSSRFIYHRIKPCLDVPCGRLVTRQINSVTIIVKRTFKSFGWHSNQSVLWHWIIKCVSWPP